MSEPATSYAAVQRTGPRETARHVALSSLAAAAALSGRTARALATPRVQILCLHHVFPDEAASFRRMLVDLSRTHEFVPYSVAVRSILDPSEPPPSRPRLTLSFDDGLSTCAQAAQIMSDLGIRAMFFIVPPMIGESDPARLERFCRDRLHQPPLTFLTWDDVERMRSQGHEFGNHTMTHADCGTLDEAALREELGKSREMIVSRLGEVRHFAWPFGRMHNFSETAARVAFDTGYESCASAVRGCHPVPAPKRPSHRVCLRRDNVVARWPLSHVRYLLAQSARSRMTTDAGWPAGWRV